MLARAPRALGLSAGGLMRLSGFGALAMLYFAWAVCDRLTDLGGDSATYMLMARDWSPFVASSPIFAAAAKGAAYPPLFPVLIGLLGGSFAAAHLLVAASLLGAIAFFYLWLRESGVGVGPSVASVLLFAAQPGTYLITLNIWSENTYLCLSLLAVLASSHFQRDGKHVQAWWWTAVLAAAAAVMTRTAGLPLLLTLAIFVVRHRPPRWREMLFAACAPFVLWFLWSRLHGSGLDLYTRQLQNSYGDEPWRHLAIQVGAETQALIVAWFGIWFGAPASWTLLAVVAAYGLLCLAGMAMRLRRGCFDAVYGLSYLLLLLVWPWPSEASRLLYVLVPVLLGQGMWLLARAARPLGAKLQSTAQYVVVALLVLAVLPGLAVCVQRRVQALPADAVALRHIAGYYSDFATDRQVAMATSQLIDDIPSLARQMPASACVFAIKPSVVTLLAERSSFGPPPAASDDREFDRLVHRCRFAYLIKGQSATFPSAFYPRERLHGRYQVLSVLADKLNTQDGEIAELVELPD